GAPPPQTIEEFREALRQGGIDATRYRDTWDRPYRIVSAPGSRYADRTEDVTVRVFGGPVTLHREVTPVTRKFITFSLRSDGPDGAQNTYDDFDVARFEVLLRDELARSGSESSAANLALKSGTGSVDGVVTDSTGAVVPNATVTLISPEGARKQASTGPDGAFR